jgi:hypothetical protein
MKVFGESVWVYAADLYLSWLGALVVGIAILGVLEADRKIKALSVVVAGTLSAPFTTGWHAHSYLSPLFAGLVIYFLLKYRRNPRGWYIFWAGIFSAVSILAKQNVGGGFGVVAALVLLLPNPLGFGSEGKAIPNLFRFLAGGTLGLLPALGYFFGKAGLQEVTKELFLDAGAGKGGVYNLLLRGFPRFTLNPHIPHSRLAELLLSLAVCVPLCCLTYAAIGRAGADSAGAGATSERRRSSLEENGYSRRYLWWFSLTGLAVFVATLFDLPRVRLLVDFLHPRFFHVDNWSEVAIQGVYLAVCCTTLACAVGIFRKRVPKEVALPCLLLLALAYANSTSSISNFGFVAPVAVPLWLYVLDAAGLPNLSRWSLAMATIFLLCACLFPTFAKTFCPLYPLPKNSPFAGLYADSAYHRWVTEIWQNVTPRIRGKRTLWLYPGGPLSAFGGLPVPNVIYLHIQSYSSRSERHLWDAWHNNPPEYVVLGEFNRARNAVLFQRDSLAQWLSSAYVIDWQDQELRLALWKKVEE